MHLPLIGLSQLLARAEFGEKGGPEAETLRPPVTAVPRTGTDLWEPVRASVRAASRGMNPIRSPLPGERPIAHAVGGAAERLLWI